MNFPPAQLQRSTITFPDTVGSLEFACHTEGHYEAGMRSPITVE